MQYWLLKSEPDVWSIDQQKKSGNKGAPWDGVRNYQAAKNLKSISKNIYTNYKDSLVLDIWSFLYRSI